MRIVTVYGSRLVAHIQIFTKLLKMNAIEGELTRHELTDPGFMQAINARQKGATHTLYMEYSGALYSYALRITLVKEEARDVVSETFTRFLRHQGTFESIPKIRNFLYTVAHNISCTYLRDRQLHDEKHQELLSTADEMEPAILNQIIQNELYAALYDLINQLPDTKKRIIQATILEGKTAAEIAKELGMTEANVYKTKERTLLSLRAYAVSNNIRYAWPIWYLLSKYL